MSARIFVKVKPDAKNVKVQKLDEDHYIVAVKESPVHGKANIAVVNTIAYYFGKSALRVRIISGHTSKQKIIEIL